MGKWITSKARHLRTPHSIARTLNSMEKKYGSSNISVDHGIANYKYSHYELEEASFSNHYISSITIYVEDFTNGKIVEYNTVTEDDLRRPTKEDMEWRIELVTCYVEPDFPTILNMREYTA